MTGLTVRIKKKTDGEAALACERADGSVTWQRQDGAQGSFFPPHDLTHFAVESVLAFDSAFYGLIMSGWDITDFAAPRVKDRLPEQALIAELLVGFLDAERTTGVVDDAAAFDWKIATYREAHQLPPTTFRVTDAQLADIRARRAELLSAWHALPSGETLALHFPGR